MKRLALALGGGNIDQFGVLAGALTALEEILGAPLHEKVTRAAGTSAGALAASLLMTGRLDDLVEITQRLHGKDLVKRHLLGEVSAGLNLYRDGAMFEPTGLRRMIDDYLPDDLLAAVPPYALAAVVTEWQATPYREEWIYAHQGGPIFRPAVLGSSSVPFVLPVVRAELEDDLEHAWVDGGVVATHPTRAALYPQIEGQEIEALITISSYGPKNEPKKLKRGGLDGILGQVKALTRSWAVAQYVGAWKDAEAVVGKNHEWITADTGDYSFDATPELLAISRHDGYEAVMARRGDIEALVR